MNTERAYSHLKPLKYAKTFPFVWETLFYVVKLECTWNMSIRALHLALVQSHSFGEARRTACNVFSSSGLFSGIPRVKVYHGQKKRLLLYYGWVGEIYEISSFCKSSRAFCFPAHYDNSMYYGNKTQKR